MGERNALRHKHLAFFCLFETLFYCWVGPIGVGVKYLKIN